jgi:hypothetical protein
MRRREREREGGKVRRKIEKFTKTIIETKTCFGHNMSRKSQNKMKFNGYVCSDEGYKSTSEGHWIILLQFSRKCKLVTFEDLGRAQ